MKNLLPTNLVIASHENKFGLVIEQKQARQLKTSVTEQVAALIAETFDVETVQTAEGLYILIPNDEEGAIPVCLDIKVKPLDTDVEVLHTEYIQKQEDKAQKAKEKAAKAK